MPGGLQAFRGRQWITIGDVRTAHPAGFHVPKAARKFRSHSKEEMRFAGAEHSPGCFPPSPPWLCGMRGRSEGSAPHRPTGDAGSGSVQPIPRAEPTPPLVQPLLSRLLLCFPLLPRHRRFSFGFWALSRYSCKSQACIPWITNKTLNSDLPNFWPGLQTGTTSITTPKEGVCFTPEYASADHAHKAKSPNSVDISKHQNCKHTITDDRSSSCIHASFKVSKHPEV